MASAVLCPVCKGKGKVNEAWVNLPEMTAREDSKEKTCNGCSGKGWVEVGGKEPSYPWLAWPPNPIPFYPYTYSTRGTWTYTSG